MSRSIPTTGPRAGHAALTVVVGLLSVCGALLAFVATAFGPSVEDLDAIDPTTLRAAAEDAIALSIAGLWGPLEHATGPRGVDLADGRARLAELGLESGGPPVDLSALVADELPALLGDVLVESVTARRTESGRRTFVHLDVVVRDPAVVVEESGDVHAADAPGALRTEVVLELAQAPWDRDGLALATWVLETSPNTSVRVDSAARIANRDPELAGSFDGVRAAVLGDLVGRHDLVVAGSLLVGGRLVDRVGREVIEPSRAGLGAVRLDPDGRVVERVDAFADDGAFEAVERVVVPTLVRDTGMPEALYLDQGSRPGWPAKLPTFDALVDAMESGGELVGNAARLRVVATPVRTAAEAHGFVDLAAPRAFVPSGEEDGVGLEVALEGEDDASVAGTGAAERIRTVAPGSLVAIGVPGDPLVLDGDLVVEGDLVLAGVVEGSGRLFVRGTAYLPTDLLAEPGSVAIIAEHSVVVGHPFDASGALRAELGRVRGPLSDLVAPTDENLASVGLAQLFDGLLAERARWRPVSITAALHGCEAVVVSAAPGAVGLGGAVDVIGCVTGSRVAVDAPAGLRVLFDSRAPRAAALLDPKLAALRRLGEPLGVAP